MDWRRSAVGYTRRWPQERHVVEQRSSSGQTACGARFRFSEATKFAALHHRCRVLFHRTSSSLVDAQREICQWCYPKLPKVIAVRAYATVLNDARASCHEVSALLSSFRYFVAEHIQHIWERLGLASLSQCKHIRVPEASGGPESGKVCGLSIGQTLPLPSNILLILSTGSSSWCTQFSPCPTHLSLPKCQPSLHSLHCSSSLALRFPAMLLGRHATSVRSTGYEITTSLV
jgi:hypothetical protein